MCGISALFEPGESAPLGHVMAMNDHIAHRGPDSEGYVVLSTGRPPRTLWGADTDHACRASQAPYAPREAADRQDEARGYAVLGHRRLSILDLSPTGHQPMSYDDGNLWVTFNGEIYNFVELRRELEGLGRRFVGTSDTEVLLAAFAEWGLPALERLRGMFAFVLVDRRQATVLAARDRFGIKPLYYVPTANGGVALGSEIKQFVAHLPGTPRVNGPRLYDFLNFAIHDHTDETMFQGVNQVPAGGYLRFRTDDPVRLSAERWYRLEPQHFAGSFPDAAERMRALLEQSVAEHLRSDVPVGSCLSGGLDSSTLVCLIQRELGSVGSPVPQRTFTATSSDRTVDETDWAALVSSAVGSEAHLVQPDMAALADCLPQLHWHMDEPFGSSSIYAQWNVFQLAASSRTKVLLDGQGADEQLAGYMPYFAWRLVELAAKGKARELAAEVRSLRRIHPDVVRRTVMLAGYLTAPKPVGRRLGRLVRAPGQTPDLWLSRAALGVEGYPDPLEQTGARARGVQALAKSQLTASNLPMLLHYEDRDSMAHSIEARVPFLDHRVVEFSTGLPSSFLICCGETKRVLREAMRGVLPERTRVRVDKIGFETAEEQWLRENPALVTGLVAQAVESLGGAVLPSVHERLRRVYQGAEPFGFWVWRVISAGQWAMRFGVTLGR